MFNRALILSVIFGLACGSCTIGNSADPNGKAKASDPANYFEKCASALRGQIRREFEAALQYLVMGAHFAQDDVNLPGLSGMFFEHADEERQHGIAFIDYLRMRGDVEMALLGPENNDSLSPMLSKTSWADAEEALRDALGMEKVVSASIKDLIDACSTGGVEDYQAADWLTANWLEEQLQGQRKLAGMINSLATFRRDHEELADWMFDQHIQSE